MEHLPEPKPPKQLLQIQDTTHLARVRRLVEVLSTPSQTPKKPHKRQVHDATLAGLSELLCLSCHGMTVEEMEGFLLRELPSSPDKLRIIRFAIYAIDRHLRKEAKFEKTHEERLLQRQSRHPHK
jgi:hypothetical protein